jgi:hypothetical protein
MARRAEKGLLGSLSTPAKVTARGSARDGDF